jgi:uncharacterized membrane protein YhaH (DUF805 family)
MNLDFQYLFTSFDGRINRAKFWAAAVTLLIVWLIFGLFVNSIFGGTIFGAILLILALAILFYAFYAVAAKRFQDRDKPGNMALYGLVPAFIANLLALFGLVGTQEGLNALGWICALVIWGVAIWFLIELGILKGTPGPNRFGGDPLAAVG